MNQIADIAELSYSYSKSHRKSPIAIEKLTYQEEDQVLDFYPQLVTPQYRGWFVKRLRAIGRTEFVRLADKAIKEGTSPQKMFVGSLKDIKLAE